MKNELSRDEVFVLLKKQGVDEVQIEFSGGGDEGSVEGIVLFDAEGNTIEELDESWPQTIWNPETQEWDAKEEPTDKQKLANALAKPVYDKYGGFVGEFHVNGTLTWNVKEKTVKMSGEESVEQYEPFEEDVE